MFTAPAIILNLFLGASVFLLVWSLFRFPVPTEPPVHRRLAKALGADQRRTLFEQPWLAPIMSLMLTLAQRFSFGPVRHRIARDLDASGNVHGYSVEEYLALCLGCGLATGVAGGVMGFTLDLADPLLLLGLTAAGFLLPMLTLHSEASSRLMRVTKKLPYTLDLVALMMEAGSNFNEAVETIVRDEPDDDFNQELRLAQIEIQYGATRAQALSNMANRIPLDSLRSIVGAVNQAGMLGTPLSVILKSQSGMLRMHRSVRAEKLSASAGLRILLPTMLILVAVILIIFGPVIINWVAGGGWMGMG